MKKYKLFRLAIIPRILTSGMATIVILLLLEKLLLNMGIKYTNILFIAGMTSMLVAPSIYLLLQNTYFRIEKKS